MGVIAKKSDVAAQWGRFRAAQKSALEVTGRFETACNTGRSGAECREAWMRVGEAEAALERELQAYRRIAPARIGKRTT